MIGIWKKNVISWSIQDALVQAELHLAYNEVLNFIILSTHDKLFGDCCTGRSLNWISKWNREEQAGSKMIANAESIEIETTLVWIFVKSGQNHWHCIDTIGSSHFFPFGVTIFTANGIYLLFSVLVNFQDT